MINIKYHRKRLIRLALPHSHRGKRQEFLERSGMTLGMYEKRTKQKTIIWVFDSDGKVNWEESLSRTHRAITQYDLTREIKLQNVKQKNIIWTINENLKDALQYERDWDHCRHNFVSAVSNEKLEKATFWLKRLNFYLRVAKSLRIQVAKLRTLLHPTTPQPRGRPSPVFDISIRDFEIPPGKPIIVKTNRKKFGIEWYAIAEWYKNALESLRNTLTTLGRTCDRWKLANIIYQLDLDYHKLSKYSPV